MPNEEPADTASSPLITIMGSAAAAVVAVVLCIILAIAVGCCCLKRRQAENQKQPIKMEMECSTQDRAVQNIYADECPWLIKQIYLHISPHFMLRNKAI